MTDHSQLAPEDKAQRRANRFGLTQRASRSVSLFFGATALSIGAAAFSACSDIDPLDYVSIPVPSIAISLDPTTLALLSALPSGTWSLSNLPSNWQQQLASVNPSTIASVASALPSGFNTAVIPPAASSVNHPPTTPSTTPTASSAAVVQSAPPGFEACTVCHGSVGQGGTAPEIQHTVKGYATYTVRNGRPGGMPAFSTSTLSDTQLNAILTFLSAAPQPKDGPALYKDYCANCHGAAMTGIVGRGPTLKGKGAIANGFVRAGSAGVDYGSSKYMPSWPTTALSDAEVQSIAAILQ